MSTCSWTSRTGSTICSTVRRCNCSCGSTSSNGAGRSAAGASPTSSPASIAKYRAPAAWGVHLLEHGRTVELAPLSRPLPSSVSVELSNGSSRQGPQRRTSAHAATGAEPSLSTSLSSTPRGLPARVHLAQVTQTKRESTHGIDSLLLLLLFRTHLKVCVCAQHLKPACSYELIENVQTWRRGPARNPGNYTTPVLTCARLHPQSS